MPTPGSCPKIVTESSGFILLAGHLDHVFTCVTSHVPTGQFNGHFSADLQDLPCHLGNWGARRKHLQTWNCPYLYSTLSAH